MALIKSNKILLWQISNYDNNSKDDDLTKMTMLYHLFKEYVSIQLPNDLFTIYV